MFTAQDIKNITFSGSFKGYKKEEVEAFLDNIEADYINIERVINDYKSQIEELQNKINEFENAQDSIQNVLLNAQKLADQIVNEAKEKSEEIILRAEANINVITNKEKELSEAFELKANERKANLQAELDALTQKAQLKAKSITDAAIDAVNRQQVLFDKLKLEISGFKSSVTAKYKEHLSLLQSVPDVVDMDPQKLAELITAKIDNEVNIDDFIFANPLEPSPISEPIPEATVGFNIEDIDENMD